MRHILLLTIASVALLYVSCTHKPAASSISMADLDTSVSPSDDFFRYANGGWIDRNPIPSDLGSYDICDALSKKIDSQLLGILDSLASNKLDEGSIQQKLTLFYKSGMDTAARNAAGLKPIQFLLDSIDNIRTVADFQHVLAVMGLNNLNIPFHPRCYPDMKNCKMSIFTILQGGVGIDENYFKYPDSEGVIDRYTKHLEKIFAIAGYENAVQMAATTIGIERKLADISASYLQLQDPGNTYNKISYDELKQLMPVFDWDKYFADLGCRIPSNIIVVSGTQFISNLNKLITQIPLNDWKIFLKARTINCLATALSDDFVDEDFEFYEHYLGGAEEKSPLQVLVLNQMNQSFGDALGREYVNRYFSQSTKAAAEQMCQKLKNALSEHITNLDWMSDAAKKAALEKVDQMRIKIGYPNKYVDFAECEVGNDYPANILTIFRAQTKHELQFIDMPTDNDMWQSAPQVANMYYMRVHNYIEVPAAMLQPPFFYPNGDDAVNYGAIGAAIGHEITHGFDNAGRFYDKDGNLADWWSDNDSIEFVRRSEKLVKQFNSFVAVDTLHVDGELTLSENIADLGGINIAYTAFSKTQQWRDQTILTDGLTPDQRFFIAYARTWAGDYRDQFAHDYTLTNEHALGKFRVEGPLPNLDAFVKAFNVKPGDRYYIADSLRTEIW